MQRIVFTDLEHDAKELKLNIKNQNEFHKFITDLTCETANMLNCKMIFIWLILEKINTNNPKIKINIKKLINLDAYSKVNFKKPISDYAHIKLFPTIEQLNMFRHVEFAKSQKLDLFQEKDFNLHLARVFSTIKKNNKYYSSIYTLDHFSKIIFCKSIMNREIPESDEHEDIVVKITEQLNDTNIEKKIIYLNKLK